jgi:hypothetical protein
VQGSGGAVRCAVGYMHEYTQQRGSVQGCVTLREWGTYLARRRVTPQAAGARKGAGGGRQAAVELACVVLAGLCGAQVGPAALRGGRSRRSGGEGRGTLSGRSGRRRAAEGAPRSAARRYEPVEQLTT